MPGGGRRERRAATQWGTAERNLTTIHLRTEWGWYLGGHKCPTFKK